MNEHIDDLDVARFRAGKLDRATIERIGAHVRTCPECSSRVWGSAAVRDAVSAVSRNASTNRTRIRWIAVAAAVVLAIIGAIVAYNAWHRAPGGVVVKHPPVPPRAPVHAWDALVANALRTGTLEPSASLVALRRGGAEIVRGPKEGGAKVRLLAPVGVSVESPSPQFRWTSNGGSYEVTVAHNGDVVAKSGRIRETTWTPPEPLQRGVAYEWQLAIEKDGHRWRVPAEEDLPARFRVLSDEEWRLLASARASTDPLAAAIVAAHLGILDDALTRLDASRDPRARVLAEKIRRW